jgi:hypothetical protein
MAQPIAGIPDPPPIDTINEYAMSAGQNLPNHSTSIAGRGRFVRQGVPEVPTFRTKQQAFRYAAWLIEMAGNHLPDEDGCASHTFEEVRAAITNT